MDNALLAAYCFDGLGGGKALSSSEVPDQLQNDDLLWVHLDATQEQTETWLRDQNFSLDPFVIEALLADETRPRMTQFEDGVLLILRGANLNDDASPEDMVSIRLWIDKNRIISTRRRRLKAVQDLEMKIKTGKGPKTPGQFICMLVSQIFLRMEPSLTALDETTDNIEEQILEMADGSMRALIINVRKQAIIFRRYMAPQRDALQSLLMSDIDWLSESDRRHLQENYNHILRYVEDLDALRERAQIVKDELANLMSDKLNKNMYILSVIAAVFLPLGFLTGLLGINVGGIPGAENQSSFMIFCLILTIIVSAQVWLFKKLKWF